MTTNFSTIWVDEFAILPKRINRKWYIGHYYVRDLLYEFQNEIPGSWARPGQPAHQQLLRATYQFDEISSIIKYNEYNWGKWEKVFVITPKIINREKYKFCYLYKRVGTLPILFYSKRCLVPRTITQYSTILGVLE